MDIRETIYYGQVELLLQILPFISKATDFALKGGTAINLFVRDLPRLSVDIDLTYVPINDRSTALERISNQLENLISQCEKQFGDIRTTTKKKNGFLFGLTIVRGAAAVKIEPNTTIRGTVFPTNVRSLTLKAEELFARTVQMQVLSTEDLYGGKICAALDRQHPRDLFDIHFLFQHEGLTDKIRQAFIVYLLSHNRPISELLDPQLKDNLEETHTETFEGMTFAETTLEELIESWKELVKTIKKELTEDEKEFILSFKKQTPKWDLFPVEGIDKLPALKWKRLNIGRMSKKKYKDALTKLEKVIG